VIEYIDLADYLAIAVAVTGLDTDTIIKVTNFNLADSALHAPAAGVGDTDFYPDFVDKAAGTVSPVADPPSMAGGSDRSFTFVRPSPLRYM
jgi:death-on-curing protein